jgi:hypothetical protein
MSWNMGGAKISIYLQSNQYSWTHLVPKKRLSATTILPGCVDSGFRWPRLNLQCSFWFQVTKIEFLESHVPNHTAVFHYLVLLFLQVNVFQKYSADVYIFSITVLLSSCPSCIPLTLSKNPVGAEKRSSYRIMFLIILYYEKVHCIRGMLV